MNSVSTAMKSAPCCRAQNSARVWVSVITVIHKDIQRKPRGRNRRPTVAFLVGADAMCISRYVGLSPGSVSNEGAYSLVPTSDLDRPDQMSPERGGEAAEDGRASVLHFLTCCCRPRAHRGLRASDLTTIPLTTPHSRSTVKTTLR